MRERVYLVGGTLTFDSGESGTLVRAELPLDASSAGSPAEPTAS
jgi:signal transduction histidine kinase